MLRKKLESGIVLSTDNYDISEEKTKSHFMGQSLYARKANDDYRLLLYVESLNENGVIKNRFAINKKAIKEIGFEIIDLYEGEMK